LSKRAVRDSSLIISVTVRSAFLVMTWTTGGLVWVVVVVRLVF
jgi:hypothetical protein